MKRVLIFCCLGFAFFAGAMTVDEQIDQSSSLVGQLVNVPVAGYYASAVVYAAEEDRLLLVTNDHAIPRRAQMRRSLEFKGVVTRWQRVPVTVLGRAPGYDVALIAIPRTGTIVDDKIKFPADRLTRTIQSAFYSVVVDDPPNRGSQMTIVGVPRFWQGYDGLLSRNRTWAQDAELASTLLGRSPGDYRGGAPKGLSTHVRLKLRRDCPPPFLTQCNEVPIVSWGYSGGALLVASTVQEKLTAVPIYGLISHFSPLGESTFVIPMVVVRRVAERLRFGALLRSGGEYVETTDEEKHYEMLEDGRIKILFGPLAGKILERVDATTKQGGAGESRGGGAGESRGGGAGESRGGGAGESRGGGAGESRGGGGPIGWRPCPTCYWIVPVETGLTHFLGAWQLLRDSATRPSRWGKHEDPFTDFASTIVQVKGVDALFAFRGGAEVDGRTYYQWDLDTIGSRKDFLLAYAAKPWGTGVTFLFPWPLPSRLKQPPGWENSGMEIHTFLRRWRPIDEVKKTFARGEKSTLGYPKEDLEETIADYDDPKAKDEDRWEDLITHLETSSTGGVVREATLRPAEKSTWLDWTRSDGKRFSMVLDGAWEARGQQLRQQRGWALLSQSDAGWTAVNYFASLQKDPQSGSYELKMVMTNLPSSKDVTHDPYFTDDEIRITVVSLKLQPTY